MSFDTLAAGVVLALVLMGTVFAWIAVRPPRFRGWSLAVTLGISVAAEALVLGVLLVEWDDKLTVIAVAVAVMAGTVQAMRRSAAQPIGKEAARRWEATR